MTAPRTTTPGRAAAGVTPPRELTGAERKITIVASLLGLFLAALDQTIVATAGPAIQRDLRIPPSLYVWITTGYLVASTVMVPVYGKLSDLFGRKRILLTGITIFVLGSLLCGVSQGTFQLVAARVVQGLGAAALFTSAFTVIADLFPPHLRGKYQGLFAAVFGLSSVLGPLAGGFITDLFGWHWVFFINVPLGLVAFALATLKMPSLRPQHARRPRIDVLGTLLLIAGLTPLLLALSFGRPAGSAGATGWSWGSPQILGLLLVAAVGITLFVLVERRAAEPVVDFAQYREPAFALSASAAFVLGSSFLAGPVFLPLFLVNVVGVSATRAGISMMPLTAGIVIASGLSGQVATRLGRYRPVILSALAFLVVAFAVMAFTLTPESTLGEVSVKMALIGIGMGPTLPLYTLAIQNAVPRERLGVATSAITFARSLGQVLGVAVLGSIFAATLAAAGIGIETGEGAMRSATLAADPAAKLAFTQAITRIYTVGIGVAVVAFLITLRMPDTRMATHPGAPVVTE